MIGTEHSAWLSAGVSITSHNMLEKFYLYPQGQWAWPHLQIWMQTFTAHCLLLQAGWQTVSLFYLLPQGKNIHLRGISRSMDNGIMEAQELGGSAVIPNSSLDNHEPVFHSYSRTLYLWAETEHSDPNELLLRVDEYMYNICKIHHLHQGGTHYILISLAVTFISDWSWQENSKL